MAQRLGHPVLSNDVLLRTALRRVAGWYQSAEWQSDLELLEFQSEPSRLTSLGKELAQGTWSPKPWALIPYPKDAKRLRHYSAPAVEAQVAFMVFGVLLAPLIDAASHRFAFGNRWHRPLLRSRYSPTPSWKDGPFVFDAATSYAPYARDYGLFRRTAHWCASAATGSDPTTTERPDSRAKRQDFVDRLPDFCDSNWWPTRDPALAYWAKFDLRLAYPSVSLFTLRKILRERLSALDPSRLDRVLSRYPLTIREILLEDTERNRIIDTLIHHLREVRYTSDSIETRHWSPADSDATWKLPYGDGSAHPGLPTGLAVSGLLFNAYLIPVDDAMSAGMIETQQDEVTASAFLRFADDMLIIGVTPKAVLTAIDRLRTALTGQQSHLDLNLRLNADKMRPASLARCIRPLLSQRQALATSANALDECAWRESELRKDRVGPFVTHLVETMSRLGAEHATGRFGAAAAEQLQDLHELVHLRIEDDEVREDTRLAFASHRLASAFLAEEGTQSDAAEIARIRQSIGEAIERAPAKFSLWRAVVRAAMRRPFSADGTEEATEWLNTMLTRISTGRARSWLKGATMKPSECCSATALDSRTDLSANVEVLDLHASFLRAIFWRELRRAAADIARVPTVASNPQRTWAPTSWTFRALDEVSAQRVREWACNLDAWASLLYADGAPPVTYWWEYESLSLAAISVANAVDFLTPGARGSGRIAKAVTIRRGDGNLVFDLLSLAERVVSQQDLSLLHPFYRLLLATLAQSDQSPSTKRALLRELSTLPSGTALRLAQRLGLLVEYAKTRQKAPLQKTLRLERHIWDLETAALLRATALERASYESSPPHYIEDVLWASKEDDGRLRVEPSKVPRRGLPVRIALQMLVDGLTQLASTSGTWWTIPQAVELARARIETLRPGARSRSQSPLRTPLVSLADSENDHLPRHPAYALAERWGAESGSLATRALAQVWQFFAAAEGSEASLTQLVLSPDRSLPLDEQWRLRSRIPLPTPVWKALESLIRTVREIPRIEHAVNAAIGEIVASANEVGGVLTFAEFDWDRTDVRLELDEGPLDIPMGRVALGDAPSLVLSGPLPESTVVRLAQLTARPDWSQYYQRFRDINAPPPASRQERQAIMQQVYEAFATKTRANSGPIVMPEVSLPNEELPTVRALVAVHQRAVLAGLLWREATMSSGSRPGSGRRFLVNEAVLMAPVASAFDPALPVVREFRIRKPIPSHIEDGLCVAVSNARNEWTMLDGRAWYRFVHPAWGDFTVAICSDLVDPAPWASMSGSVLHLFLVSYNEDVDLFEQMTWVRAFELHCNVVAANHGHHGGSFVWTPRGAHAKEVAKLRGEGLLLVADVTLPVRDLEQNQMQGVQKAVKRAARTWTEPRVSKQAFKAPRPRYPGRAT